MSFKLLVLPGGGCLGAFQAKVLSMVDNVFNVDAIVGSSVGSLCGAYLATGYDASTLFDVFDSRVHNIFSGRWWRKYKLWTPRYSDSSLNENLHRYFNFNLEGLQKPTWIPAWNIHKRKAKVFTNMDDGDKKFPVWEAVRASCAAPTYFDPWKGYADGGLVENNPIMIGISGILKHKLAPLEDIKTFSIGTGMDSEHIHKTTEIPTGYISWLKYILGVYLESSYASVSQYEAEAVLGENRTTFIDFTRKDSWRMDDPGIVDEIVEVYEDFIQIASEKLYDFCVEE
jgi:hypothetical protein